MFRGAFARRETVKRMWGVLFVLPSLAFIFLYMVYPLFHSFYLSFTKYNFVFDRSPTFVGVRNYMNIFKDAEFLLSLKNTAVFTSGFLVLVMVGSLGIALMLFFHDRFAWFFRSSIFMPIVVPTSFACIVFGWIANENFGLLNFFLRDVINQPQLARGWLTEPGTAMLMNIMVTLWGSIGFQTILFLGGLQGISHEIMEAAVVDGASGLKRIWYIILPNLKETYVITGIWGIIRALKLFVQPMVLTAGGPGNATLSTYMYIYNNAFVYFDMGKAAAMAFVLSAMILLFSLLNLRLAKDD
jgi:ABC-type sugar transport system permease subunit